MAGNSAEISQNSDYLRPLRDVFQSWGAISLILLLEVKPVEEDFRELDSHMSRAFAAQNGPIEPGVIYFRWFYPDHVLKSHEVLVVRADQKMALLKAAKMIDECARERGRTFSTYAEQLKFVASQFFESLSKGTRFDDMADRSSEKSSEVSPESSLFPSDMMAIPPEDWSKILPYRDLELRKQSWIMRSPSVN